MSKLKRFFVLLLILVTLSSTSVLASNTDIGHNQGGQQGGSVSEVVEGASARRTGFLIYATDGSGDLQSEVVFVSTYGNSMTWRDTSILLSYLRTRAGEECTYYVNDLPVPWQAGPFDSNVKSAMDSFVTSPYEEFETGGEWIAKKYLRMSNEEFSAFSSLDEPHLNLESVMLSGIYNGSSFTGFVLLGTVVDFAALMFIVK